MIIEVLSFEGCPNHEPLLPRLREILEAHGLDTLVKERRINSVEEAIEQRFLGSPTVRIDGLDVDPTASNRTDFGLKCRLYATRDGLRGSVPDELILKALQEASTGSG